MTLGDWLPNAGLLLIAAFFAAHAPSHERGQAFVCFGIVAIDWLNYVLSWTPFALHFALKAMGVWILSENIWPIADAVAAAAVICCAYEYRWAWALWGCLTVQVCLHIGHQLSEGPFDPFTRLLDLFFWGQIACFVMIGGRGVRNRVVDCADRLQLWLGKIPQAVGRSKKRPQQNPLMETLER